MNKFLLFLFITFTSFSQEKTFTTQDIEVNSILKGTLYSPKNFNKKTKLVILIAGYGPTNRNGNSTITGVNNSYKFLAEGLSKNGFAVFTYDKRGISSANKNAKDEALLVFNNYIDDTKEVIAYFKSQKKIKKIVIAGHSEGSLIGMVAANGTANGYVSISGTARPIDEVVAEQIAKNAPFLKGDATKYIALLKEGKTFENKNPMLESLFRESIQPYMISWMKYNPQVEIKKLSIPILIINGTKDLQVPETDAELLHKANPKSELKIIENMNHVLKEIKNDDDNLKSYSDPKLPVAPELIEYMTKFINSI